MQTELSGLSAKWRLAVASLVVLLGAIPALAIPSNKKPVAKKKPVVRTTAATKRASTVAAKKRALARAKTGRRSIVAGGPWKEPTFADSTLGDDVAGEDLTIRQAAVNALGPYNGSVVVVDPKTGRILTIVNQKLALGSGFQPCSTIKLVCALAGLDAGIVEKDTPMRLGRRFSMDLTQALAHSNNPYFARVGEKLGFEKVYSYARELGLGERAGLGIDGEYPGILPTEPPKFGGVGMMTSFGEGIQLTPLQLASIVTAIANGGTMYHLQYPRTDEELRNFAPRVKRRLDFGDKIDEIKPGMLGAVEFGTARRAQYDPAEPILGKTGTCTDRATPTHLGWFGSYNEVGHNKLVVVVLLTGGRAVNGPVAAQIAGSVYKNLSGQQFFAAGRGQNTRFSGLSNE